MSGKWVFLCLAFGLLLSVASVYGEEWEKLFQEANQHLSRGIEGEGDEREIQINTAATLYEQIIEEGRIRNGYLYYNLGNAYYYLGEIGKAILNYRRAERLIPGYGNLRENLETAISQRIDLGGKGQLKKIVKTLSLQSYWFSYSTTLILFALFFVLLWFLLVLRLFFRPPLLKVLIALSIIGAILFGAAGGIYLYNDLTNTSGVITAKTVDARKGPGLRYKQSFTASLHEGTEFAMLNHQSGWLHIQLESGEDCWISEGDGGLLEPGALKD